MRYGSYDEGTFMDAKGTKIFYRVWRARRARGAIALFHAIGLHSGRYTWFCEELASRGFSCYAVDLFGYGLSGGPRGGNLKDVLASGEKFLQLIAAKGKISNLIVAGHGSGVLIAQHSAKAVGLKHRVLAITPLHEIAPLQNRIAYLKALSLFNLRTEIHRQPLYDIDHIDAQLEAEEDNLIVSRVPARLVLDLIQLANSRFTSDRCVTVFENVENERGIDILRRLYPCGKELYFNPQSARFPFEEVLEHLVEQKGAAKP